MVPRASCRFPDRSPSQEFPWKKQPHNSREIKGTEENDADSAAQQKTDRDICLRDFAAASVSGSARAIAAVFYFGTSFERAFSQRLACGKRRAAGCLGAERTGQTQHLCCRSTRLQTATSHFLFGR